MFTGPLHEGPAAGPAPTSTPRLASASARSLPGSPSCPRTQRQSIVWPPARTSSSRACQSSTFFTGWLGRGAPALGFPARQPLGHALEHVLAVHVQRHRAGPLERLQRLDHGHQFHAVVGGEALAAEQFLLGTAGLEQHAPAARPRIALAGAVGVDMDGDSHDVLPGRWDGGWPGARAPRRICLRRLPDRPDQLDAAHPLDRHQEIRRRRRSATSARPAWSIQS